MILLIIVVMMLVVFVGLPIVAAISGATLTVLMMCEGLRFPSFKRKSLPEKNEAPCENTTTLPSFQNPEVQIPEVVELPKEAVTEDVSSSVAEDISSDVGSAFTPIVVGDDELIEPPLAKSKLEWEEIPADDSDIITDEGHIAMLNDMAKEAECRIEFKMESYQ